MRILIIVVGFLLLSHNFIFAQYDSISITENPSDISARTYAEQAPDGTFCALLKLQTEVQDWDVLYDDNKQPIKVEQKVGEVWTYIPNTATSITIKHSNIPDLFFKFKDYKIKSLKEKTVYEVTFPVPFFFIKRNFNDLTSLKALPPDEVPAILMLYDGLSVKPKKDGYLFKMIHVNPNQYEGVGKVVIEDNNPTSISHYKQASSETINLKPGYIYTAHLYSAKTNYESSYIKINAYPLKDAKIEGNSITINPSQNSNATSNFRHQGYGRYNIPQYQHRNSRRR